MADRMAITLHALCDANHSRNATQQQQQQQHAAGVLKLRQCAKTGEHSLSLHLGPSHQ